ncbi:MAG: hypothetical protein PHD36_03485 [Desulfotomaculaceae bacterium]|nr:hypothetical protein [Desulfotomaculaceae bacterium]
MLEAKLGYTDGAGPNAAALWPVYLCFLVFGIMIPFTKPEFKLTTLLLSVLLALVVGLLAVYLLILIFNAGNPALREAGKSQFAREAVAAGMLFMIPFTVLAVLAQFGLGWNAVMPFASAAIMTAAATAGSEVVKKGAQGIKNMLIPAGLAFVLSTGWMMLVAMLP